MSQQASASSLSARLDARLNVEVSSRSLGLLRIFAALTIFVHFASPWVAHRMDHEPGAMLLAWGVLGSAWFVVFGFKTRWATALMALCFTTLHLYYGVHLDMPHVVEPIGDTVQELQVAVLLALTPCGRSLSVDRALAVKRARANSEPPPPERIKWWQLELFVIQLVAVYLWTGVAGLESSWLDGTFLELYLMQFYGSADTYVAHPGFHTIVVGVAWALTIVEFIIVVGLTMRRTRPYVVWLAVAFVLAHTLAFSHKWVIGHSYLMMLAVLIACLPPSWIHELVSRQTPRPLPTPARS